MSDFAAAFQALIGNEGGFVDNPKDPGGATKYGITERVARAHGYTGPMRDLALSTAYAIAKSEYWTPSGCEHLDDRLAFQVLDGAYNSGVSQSVKWLQHAAGTAQDGDFGPATLRAVNALGVNVLIMRYLAHRLSFMADLKTWPDFGRGWARRIARNQLKAAA